MRALPRFFFLFIFFSIAILAKAENTFVIDGNTLQIGNVIYRLHGIDAPEPGQRCNLPNGKTWRCGDEATKALVALIEGREVGCETKFEDEFGRVIAVCRVGEVELNEILVRQGNAWAFRRFSIDYALAEELAKEAGIGIWQAPTQTAEEYRKSRWENAAKDVPEGCPIKGNISQSGMIYHTPWSPWYTRTKINTAKGERWFCNEAEAIAAGWRAPKWGR